MRLPQRLRHRVFRVGAQRVLQAGQRTVAEAAGGFQPAQRGASLRQAQPAQIAHGQEQENTKEQHQRRQMQREAERGQDIEQCQAEEQAGNADTGPEGGPGRLPEQGKPSQARLQSAGKSRDSRPRILFQRAPIHVRSFLPHTIEMGRCAGSERPPSETGLIFSGCRAHGRLRRREPVRQTVQADKILVAGPGPHHRKLPAAHQHLGRQQAGIVA